MSGNALNNSAPIFDVDNLRLDGNTLSSTDTNGDIVLSPDGTGAVNINSAYTLPTADGTSGQVLSTDGAGAVSFATPSGGGSYTLIASGTGTGATVDVSLGAVYPMMQIIISNYSNSSSGNLLMRISNDNGSTVPSTQYSSAFLKNEWNSNNVNNTNITTAFSLVYADDTTVGSGTFFLSNGSFGSGNNAALVGQCFLSTVNAQAFGDYDVSGYEINFLRFLPSAGSIGSLSYAIYAVSVT